MISRLIAGLILVASTFYAGGVSADTVAIIGTGKVASALGPEFAAQGHTIVYGSRTPGGRSDRRPIWWKRSSSSAEARSKAPVTSSNTRWSRTRPTKAC